MSSLLLRQQLPRTVAQTVRELRVVRPADHDLVAETANGISAVRLASETHPDVILMDLQMPEIALKKHLLKI